MSKISDKAMKLATNVANNLSQSSNTAKPDSADIERGAPELLRQAAAEGAVLLKNDGTLPLKNKTVSVFGRVQRDYFFAGYGSGGEVVPPYTVNLIDGLRANENIKINENLATVYENWCRENPVYEGFWAHWPASHHEMELTPNIVKTARENSDVAIIIIGRNSGEDQDARLKAGGFYLTQTEENMLKLVTAHFEKTVLLFNIATVMDFSFLEKYPVSAALILWLGGMESGNAAADLITGAVNPSGHLTATVAKSYNDYPSANSFGGKNFNNYEEDIYVGYRYFETFCKEKVLFPFGFGLSYTTFNIEKAEGKITKREAKFKFEVQNTGAVNGKTAVQIYVQKPCAPLGAPARELVAFKKTKNLTPLENEKIKLTCPIKQLAVYDSVGETGFKHAYVLNAGEYKFFIGENVRDAEEFFTFTVDEAREIEKTPEALAPRETFSVIKAKEHEGNYRAVTATVPTQTVNLKNVITENLPKEIERNTKNITLGDVKAGKNTIEEFVGTLNFAELEAISRGDYEMNSPLGPEGNAGAFGGVLKSLRDKGVPPLITTDGPSGIRLNRTCTLIPVGTALACSFNESLVQSVYTLIAKEMKKKGTTMLLAPGMNIQRNPLCGRNFEYYSEDPVVTGKIASSAVLGIQSGGLSACPKHFACNNQEFARNMCDSRLSERAAREIYLKGFEICVKEAHPLSIMTSYNKVNSVYSHYNYELTQVILRGEWGYDGVIITDWWMKKGTSPEFSNVSDNAYRIRSGINVLMPGGPRVVRKKEPDGTVENSYKNGGITLAELQQNAVWILKHALNFI